MKSMCVHPHCYKTALKGQSKCVDHYVERKIERTPKKDHDSRYGKARWKRLRIQKLKQSPLCSCCGGIGNTVHHIKPVKEGGEFWDIENLETLCRECHEQEHGNRWKQETAEAREKRLNKWKGFLYEED